MSSNATTRATRIAEGKCSVCLRRRATANHPTCRTCREQIAAYAIAEYQRRTGAGLCAQNGCSEPRGETILCEPHREEKNARARARAAR